MKKAVLLFFLLTQYAVSMAQCNAPTNLSASYSNNVTTFTWDAVPGAVSHKVQFKYPSYNWANIEYEDSTTTNVFSLTGIMASVTFDWRVNTNCGTAVSGYTQSPTSFTVPCPQPQNLTTSNITTNSATLNWTHDAAVMNGYQYARLAYRVAGSNSSWIQLGQSGTGTFSLTGLQPGTTYEWCANQICGYFNSPAAIGTFTTVYPPCGITSLWLPANVTTSQATLRWIAVPNAATYFPEYRATGAANWITVPATTSLSALITGLSASTGYEWRVRTECVNNLNSAIYSGIGTFSTATPPPPPPVACAVPANVSLVSQSGRSARVSWSAVPNATAYHYYYRANNGNSWIGITVNNGTSYNKNNYLANMTYLFKVRAVCGSGTSAFSPEGTFTTGGQARMATLSVEDEAEQLVLYPNPSDGEFTVRVPAQARATSWQVLNSSGAVLLKQSLNHEETFDVNIRSQSTGMYFLQVQADNGRKYVQKIVKK
jgi:hypothetical protein